MFYNFFQNTKLALEFQILNNLQILKQYQVPTVDQATITDHQFLVLLELLNYRIEQHTHFHILYQVFELHDNHYYVIAK